MPVFHFYIDQKLLNYIYCVLFQLGYPFFRLLQHVNQYPFEIEALLILLVYQYFLGWIVRNSPITNCTTWKTSVFSSYIKKKIWLLQKKLQLIAISFHKGLLGERMQRSLSVSSGLVSVCPLSVSVCFSNESGISLFKFSNAIPSPVMLLRKFLFFCESLLLEGFSLLVFGLLFEIGAACWLCQSSSWLMYFTALLIVLSLNIIKCSEIVWQYKFQTLGSKSIPDFGQITYI